MKLHKITIGKLVFWDITDCSEHEQCSQNYFNQIAEESGEICTYEVKNLRACYLQEIFQNDSDIYDDLWKIIKNNA